MREVAPTRSAAIELADERRLMRQGYQFLDEKRTLLAAEMLRQLKAYRKRTDALAQANHVAAAALAAAVERHGLDQLQVYPAPAAPSLPAPQRTLFLGLAMLTVEDAAPIEPSDDPPAVDASPEAKACRAAFRTLTALAADIAARAGNLERLAREYKRTERRAQALEKVLLPEVEDAMRRVDEQLDTMEREETIRTRWSGRDTD
ncbi:MAG: ATPase [Rhodopseudomonas sp.]|nr:ATPase [Rhodopseudomonas sp.]